MLKKQKDHGWSKSLGNKKSWYQTSFFNIKIMHLYHEDKDDS